MADSRAVIAFDGVAGRLAGRLRCATASASQVQQAELSGRILDDCADARACRAGFCFRLGVGGEGSGGYFENALICLPHIVFAYREDVVLVAREDKLRLNGWPKGLRARRTAVCEERRTLSVRSD